MNTENLTEVQKEEIENMIEKFHQENREKGIILDRIHFGSGKLYVFLHALKDGTNIVHKNLCFLSFLMAEREKGAKEYSRDIKMNFRSKLNGLSDDEKIFISNFQDNVAVPNYIIYNCHYKNDYHFNIHLTSGNHNEELMSFDIFLTYNSMTISQSERFVSSEELLNHLKEMNADESHYNEVQTHIKNSFVKYCRQHKLDTMSNFDTALALTKNIFELYDLDTVRLAYKELYNKTEEDSYKYIKENEKLLTEFYGFSNYENFNKFLNNLKDEIENYINRSEN